MKKIKGFEKYVEGYKVRLRLFRIAVSADSQQDVANALEIDSKRWNNYERGYLIPREIAFLLREKFPGMSAEWLWFGESGNLSPQFKKKLSRAETKQAALSEAEAELAKAKKRIEQLQKG